MSFFPIVRQPSDHLLDTTWYVILRKSHVGFFVFCQLGRLFSTQHLVYSCFSKMLNNKHTFILAYAWFVMAIAYYGLNIVVLFFPPMREIEMDNKSAMVTDVVELNYREKLLVAIFGTIWTVWVTFYLNYVQYSHNRESKSRSGGKFRTFVKLSHLPYFSFPFCISVCIFTVSVGLKDPIAAFWTGLAAHTVCMLSLLYGALNFRELWHGHVFGLMNFFNIPFQQDYQSVLEVNEASGGVQPSHSRRA